MNKKMELLHRINQIVLKKSLYNRMERKWGTDDLRTALYLAGIHKSRRDHQKKYVSTWVLLFLFLFYLLLVALVIFIQEVVFK